MVILKSGDGVELEKYGQNPTFMAEQWSRDDPTSMVSPTFAHARTWFCFSGYASGRAIVRDPPGK